uniref:Uncharacterized protein n=1 Tax=Anguilla anguilla TaxID=7936 RepID=A0A0E9X9E8_ANGAN
MRVSQILKLHVLYTVEI